jgi:hypothetical protein
LNITGRRKSKSSYRLAILLTLALVAGALESVHLFSDRTKRLREIYGPAFQVAHPEYRIVLGQEAAVSALVTTMPIGAFELRPSLQGRSTYGSIGINVLGIASSPTLPKARINELLSSFEGGHGNDDQAKTQARREIADLPNDAWITAIVELSSPLTESELNSVAPASSMASDAIYPFLSERQGSANIPVYWRPCVISEEQCTSTSAIQLYRRWTSHLSWTDIPNLNSLNLDIGALRRAAKEGRIYGFLTYGYPKIRLAETLEKPGVRTVKIAAIERRK